MAGKYDFIIMRLFWQHLPLSRIDDAYEQLEKITNPGASVLISDAHDAVRCFAPPLKEFQKVISVYKEQQSEAERNRDIIGTLKDWADASGMWRVGCDLPLILPSTITAVNINGGEARRAFRDNDRWFIDLRIDELLQFGNEIYRYNELDRSHMVRRLDPVWGTRQEAQEANEDTFHYVNAAPQHKDLNRKDWSSLEDYILDSTKARDLKVSVLTGPVLRKSDHEYRGLVKLPEEFWKVAVLVNADTNELSATGYVLSQGEIIKDLTGVAFVFGEFRTYQVQISKIEAVTGLDFGRLRDVDAKWLMRVPPRPWVCRAPN